MAVSTQDREFLKGVYQQLTVEPLAPGDARYQPVFEEGEFDDPVELLKRNIEFSDFESRMLFSGFRGAGKTTQLFRLKEKLEASGYVVLYSDAVNYLNSASEIDIFELLIVLAGSFSDALVADLQLEVGTDSYWDRIANWLKTTDVNLKELGFKAGADLKLELKTAPTFRQTVSKAMASRVGELHAQVQLFFEDAVQAIRKRYPSGTQIVYIFDSLEKFRGSVTNEQNVLKSVELLFSNHLSLLNIPYVHVVYTIPPWLKFVLPGLETEFLTCTSMWLNDEARTTCPPGLRAMEQLIEKRFGKNGMVRFFGANPMVRANALILLCGGHIRDLLLLLRETVLRTDSLPISDAAISSAISRVRSTFLPIALEDAKWLAGIAKGREALLKTSSPEDVSRFTRFIDTHLVLYLKENGTEWYDVHPLIREEVFRLTAIAQEPSERAD